MAKKQAKAKKNWIWLAVALAVLVACGAGIGVAVAARSGSDGQQSSAPGATGDTAATDWVEIAIEGYGAITAELYGNIAPVTVANFMKLVDEGFYDGLTFHRIISGFMIQGGDPNGNGTGGSSEKIKGEFSANGVENSIGHVRGVLSMARSSAYDSASSQFFIMHADAAYLDGQYAAFGRVLEGLEVVDAICENTRVQDSNGTVARADQPVIEHIRRIDQPK